MGDRNSRATGLHLTHGKHPREARQEKAPRGRDLSLELVVASGALAWGARRALAAAAPPVSGCVVLSGRGPRARALGLG